MIVNEKGGTEKDMDIATLVVVVLVIAVALTFDFTNGFHDTANAMATSKDHRLRKVIDKKLLFKHELGKRFAKPS